MKTLLITFALAAIAGPALAGPAPVAPVTKIAVADLNLADPSQAQEMLTRIRKAATAVCAASPGTNGTHIAAIEAMDACRTAAVRSAVERLDSPTVRAAFQGVAPTRALADNR